MYVKYLQEYLDKFTDGKRGNAISNARAYIEMDDGSLREIRRIEVLESTLIGDTSVLVAFKTDKEQKIAIKSPTFKKT